MCLEIRRCSVIILWNSSAPRNMEKLTITNWEILSSISTFRRQCSDERRGSTLGPSAGPSGSFQRWPGWSNIMTDGRKWPGPPDDPSWSRRKQRFSLPNYPDPRPRNKKKAIAGALVVLGMFLTPGGGCCRRNARIYLAWVLSSAVFRDVSSCLLCDDARDCWCGWWPSCFMARFSKIGK